MIIFDQIHFNLDKIPIGSNMNLYNQMWVIILDPIWSNMIQYDPIWSNMIQYESFFPGEWHQLKTTERIDSKFWTYTTAPPGSNIGPTTSFFMHFFRNGIIFCKRSQKFFFRLSWKIDEKMKITQIQ